MTQKYTEDGAIQAKQAVNKSKSALRKCVTINEWIQCVLFVKVLFVSLHRLGVAISYNVPSVSEVCRAKREF